MSKGKDSVTRSQIREHIFKIIFTKDFIEEERAPEQISLYLDNLTDDDGNAIILNDEDRDYIADKSAKILESVGEIDEVINKNSKGWSTSRIGKAELAILRVAVYEILFDENIPDNVAINEAVELAKSYGEADAPAFINGILAAVKPKDSGAKD